MTERSLFCFSAIFPTEPLTKKLLGTRRPPAGSPAASSAQGGDAQGRAKERPLTSQDGHFHVAMGHWLPVTRAPKGGAAGKTLGMSRRTKPPPIPAAAAGGRDLAAREPGQRSEGRYHVTAQGSSPTKSLSLFLPHRTRKRRTTLYIRISPYALLEVLNMAK